MMTRGGRLALIVSAVVFVSGACGAPEGTSGRSSPGPSFWSLINRLAVDYEYHDTLQALWGDSDVAVIGHMKNVREGRGLGGKKGQDVTTESVIVTFQVDEVVRGQLNPDSRRIVDLELRRPSLVSVNELDDATPDDRMLLLIYDQAGTLPNVEIDESGAERDPGKTLYALTTHKALFIEHDSGLTTPLNTTPGPFEESFDARTIDELAQEIRGVE